MRVAETDPLLKATTIKYEHRYSQHKSALQRSVHIFLGVLLVVFCLDIARLSTRWHIYGGSGNMLPQAIVVALIFSFLLFFRTRYKTSLLVVVYITTLTLFFLFSMAILPSFIKDIIVEFDPLCPVLMALTGLSAIVCAFCTVIAYQFLKFHRKYIKRKATLPVVLHSSWPRPGADVSSEEDPKMLQEQWEKFQQSRLYLPESKLQSRIVPPPALTSLSSMSSISSVASLTSSQEFGIGVLPPVQSNQQGLPPLLTPQERWERFQRSPMFHSVNNGDVPPGAQIPTLTRKRAPTSGDPPRPNFTLNRSTNVPPTLPPPVTTSSSSVSSSLASSSSSVHSNEQTPYPLPIIQEDGSLSLHPTTVAATTTTTTTTTTTNNTQTSPQRMLIQRNPSFKYGAYVHEPTHFRAHPDDTPEEYTRLAVHNRTISFPNMDDNSDGNNSNKNSNELVRDGLKNSNENEVEKPIVQKGEESSNNNDENGENRERDKEKERRPPLAYAHALGSHRTNTHASTQPRSLAQTQTITQTHALGSHRSNAYASTQESPNTPQVTAFDDHIEQMHTYYYNNNNNNNNDNNNNNNSSSYAIDDNNDNNNDNSNNNNDNNSDISIYSARPARHGVD